MKFFVIAVFTLTIANAVCQVNIDKPVVFTSPNDSDRQVLNVAVPIDPNDGVSVAAFRNGTVSHGIAVGTNDIQIDLSPDVLAYSNGMMLSFVATSSNTDTVFVSTDGLAPVLVKRPDGLPLDPGDILAGQVVALAYLNGNFILHGRKNDACPIGSIKVNDTYCIQVNESGPEHFFDAALNCHDQGGRLCKWDEYYYACQRTDLNLQYMHNNWEWIDDTSDHSHTADQVNRWSCKSQHSEGAIVTISSHYRCCFSIR